jgi:hypothetical protein
MGKMALERDNLFFVCYFHKETFIVEKVSLLFTFLGVCFSKERDRWSSLLEKE